MSDPQVPGDGRGTQPDAASSPTLEPGRPAPSAAPGADPTDASAPDASDDPGNAVPRPRGSGAPAHPVLQAAHLAFAAGDNRGARDLLATLTAGEPLAVLDERDALLRRLRPDPVALLVALAGLIVISVVAYLALTRGA